MPRFEVFSPDHRSCGQLVAPEAKEVLNFVDRLGLKKALIERNSAYSFSVRLDNKGLWCIFQRDNDPRAGNFGWPASREGDPLPLGLLTKARYQLEIVHAISSLRRWFDLS